MYGKLERLNTKPDAIVSDYPLRTTQMEGLFEFPPTAGTSFRIIGEAITPGTSGRLIITSVVKEVQPVPGGWIFQTMNSRYSLTLKEAE